MKTALQALFVGSDPKRPTNNGAELVCAQDAPPDGYVTRKEYGA